MKKRRYPKRGRESPGSQAYRERLWLEEQREEMKRLASLPSYSTFDDYAVANPEGERFRAWLTSEGYRPDILLVPGIGPHGSLPGGYLWAYVEEAGASWPWTIHVGDNDDGLMRKEFANERDAYADLEMLALLAPFHMSELKEFGFDWDP